jgi:hypothetical protein
MLRNIVSFIKDADVLLALALASKAALAAVKSLPNWQGQLLWDADLLENVRHASGCNSVTSRVGVGPLWVP